MLSSVSLSSIFFLITRPVTDKIFHLFFLYLHYIAMNALSSVKGQHSRPLFQPGVSSCSREALTIICEKHLEKLALVEPSKT